MFYFQAQSSNQINTIQTIAELHRGNFEIVKPTVGPQQCVKKSATAVKQKPKAAPRKSGRVTKPTQKIVEYRASTARGRNEKILSESEEAKKLEELQKRLEELLKSKQKPVNRHWAFATSRGKVLYIDV